MVIGHGPRCMIWAAVLTVSGVAHGAQVPIAVQDKIVDYFASSFVRPQTNKWQFDDEKPYLGRDRVVCGRVDFESAAQKYVGIHHFYAIIHDDGVSLGQLESPDDDTTGARAAKIQMLCGG